MYAMPPTSATQVSRLTNWPANSVARPEPYPIRSRTISNTGRLATIATRPHISE